MLKSKYKEDINNNDSAIIKICNLGKSIPLKNQCFRLNSGNKVAAKVKTVIIIIVVCISYYFGKFGRVVFIKNTIYFEKFKR